NTPKPSEDLLPSVKAAFKKSRSFCPKCGRKLRSPEAQCLKCGSKKRVINRLLKYLRPKRTLLVIGLILSVFSTILALTPPYMNKILLDDVLVVQEQTSHENAEQNNFSSDETDEQIAAAVRDKKLADLYVIVALLAAIFLLHRLMSSVQGYLFRIVSNTFSNVFKKDVFAKAQYLAMNFYDKTTTGSVMNRISGDTSNIQGFVMQLARDVIVQLFTMIGIIGFMFVMDWRLTLISLTPVPVLVLLSRRYGHLIWPKFRRLWRRSASISGTMTDSIPGIRVIKTFSGEERSINKYGQHIDDYQKVDLEIARIAAVYPTMIGFLVSIGSLAIWLIGGTWVIESNGLLTLGTLVAFIAYTGQFYGPVNFFLGLNESYNNTIVSMEKVMEILDADPESDYGHSNKLKRIEGKIEFIDVNFSFDRSKKVINNACFVIEPGDVVGIVGTTGAGKSTLINLLMRFYEDYEGEILIDGINIKDIDMSYFRSQIGYVQQEPMMFRDTVYNNIAYADPTAHVEQVLAAAEIANAHHFISKFPDGYDTFLGERGVGLSGGEKQRVSIARAVLRNPSILMFDEATSAVDSETEKLIQEAIEQMIAGRTTLMIAHRLSTLRKANKIIVVDGGNIIEFGTPEELMEKQGKYYKLIQIQTMSEQVTNMKREERFE
ncbi:MAG: ABC transporter transmembrane domain-containing protein, partial [Defluviitaleaceae bacterium]|nr:ABC transporter transmembrane domain-containing protein [Defluviitaleaceae bacterium]